jgi:uncharacterized repeat protein (TIGR03843 family)
MTEQTPPSSGTQAQISLERVLALLSEGEMELEGQFMWGSNYTFLARVGNAETTVLAVYKPSAGERPLWDFDRSTLCRREVATYLLSVHLGWPAVPPTVLRNGPHGPGSVQLYVDALHEEHFFSLRDAGRFEPEFRQIALFDFLINNADRKGGHCMLDIAGQLWSIDHGLTFHEDYKLRTVIWDYAGQPIPEDWLDDLEELGRRLRRREPLRENLVQLLSSREIRALTLRLEQLLETAVFPRPGPGRNIPYPLV